MPYAIVHPHTQHGIGPSGVIKDVEGTPLDAQDVDAYNRAVEAQELERIRSGKEERLFLYVRAGGGERSSGHFYHITTWLGTRVDTSCYTGDRMRMGFGFHSYRRHLTTCIAGVWYHGWYMESSGDYVRLKRAKRNYITGKEQ